MDAQRTPSDGELLAEFAATKKEAAFAELVRRHGPMVHAAGQRILNDHHQAEDVTQAVFLVLARKAAALRKELSVGGWLYTVARRLALKTRQSQQRRQEREQIAMNDQPSTAVPVDTAVFRRELDAALGQLPERYRQPLVLFHLEGRSLDETGRALRLNPNTLRTRLDRARDLLRKKLVRRGIAVGSVGALTALLSAESGAANLPVTFVAATTEAVTGGGVSATVAALTKGALNMLFWNTMKTAAITAACVGAIGISAVVAQRAANPSPATPAAPVTDVNGLGGTFGGVADNGEVIVNVTSPARNPVGGGKAVEVRVPTADGRAAEVRAATAKFAVGDNVKVLYVLGADRKRLAVDIVKPNEPTPPALRQLVVTGNGVAPRAVTGDPAKVFKPIDQTQSGTYADGKWFYSYTIASDGPQKGYRQGFLRYGAADLIDPEPGAYILTPWGWMQWQDRPTRGNWLPVAERPAKGKQLPDPATHPEIVSRPPPTP
jgi:RNA polymerase sigma factor (sigma-70 family)